MVNLANLKLRNPIILASGLLGYAASSFEKVMKAGASAVVTKSIGMKPREGFPNPTMVEIECGLLNAMGLPNPGVNEFVREIKIAKRARIPVVVSIYGFTVAEFVKAAELVEKAGADAIELNASCPHVKGVGAQIGQSPHVLAEVVKKVKSAVKKPVFTKLTPDVTDITVIARAAEKSGTDAITAVNTAKAMTIDVETGNPILANKIGGLSGPALKPVAVRCVYEIYETVKVPIIGCGGITTWRDAVEFMLAGATAIQIGTAIMYKGLEVFKEVTDGIQSYLTKKGYRSVKEIVGLSHTN